MKENRQKEDFIISFVQKKRVMSAKNNEVDLKTFLVNFITFHLKHLKFFLFGFFFFLLGTGGIIFFFPEHHQTKAIFSVGSIPVNLINKENESYYATCIENGKWKRLRFEMNQDSMRLGFVTFDIYVTGDTLGIQNFITEYVKHINNSILIKNYLSLKNQMIKNELVDVENFLDPQVHNGEKDFKNLQIEGLIELKSKLKNELLLLKKISFVKIIGTKKIKNRTYIFIFLYFFFIVVITYFLLFIKVNKKEILVQLKDNSLS